MELRRPELKDKKTILEMMQEFENETMPHDGGFWSSDSFSYEDWLNVNLNNEMGFNIPDHFVPSIQFVGFEGDRAIGFLSLRIRLNSALLEKGGHIGYSVRPSDQGKGYGKNMLSKALPIARSKGIGEILLTCQTDNAASRSVILANGGVLENIIDSCERYWIRE